MQWIGKHYNLGLWGLIGFLLLSGCGQSPSTTEQGDTSAESLNYDPTPYHPQEVGDNLVGPTLYTVEARDKELWMYFDFSQGSVVGVQNLKTDDWDLVFQRHVIRTNSGDTNPAGQAGVLAVPGDSLAAVTEVPPDANFVADVRTKKRLHAHNPEIHKWYSYNYTNNVLYPKPLIYLVRTQDGKYAKIRIVSYYCKDDEAGCMTFEYVYQGDGSRNLNATSEKIKVSQHLESR